MSRSTDKPRIIAVVGVDGSGKTTLTNWLKQELHGRGYKPEFVWSRFNNYFSLPFLMATRLSGHNVYQTHAGIRMGFHNFESLPVTFRYLFFGLQAIDVNIATYFKIRRPSQRNPVTICERGPWDTLVDVMADTALDMAINPSVVNIYCWQVLGASDIVLVDRSADLIERTRSELRYDVKLRSRQRVYKCLAKIGSWKILDNNGDIASTKEDFSQWLTAKGY